MPDNIDKLFEIMQAKGAASDRGKFRKVFLTPGNKGYKIRKDIYDGLRADGIIDSPTYEDFRRKLRLGGTPTVNKYRQQMFNSVDPNKSRASELTHRAVGQAVRATNNVRKPVTAKVLNRKGKPTGNEFAITPAKTVEDLDREYAQETTKNWENELHDQMADADRDAAKISDMFKSFIGSTDEVGSVWGNMTRGGGIAGTPHSVTTNNGIMENTEARQILAAGDYNRKRRELLQLEQDSRNGAIFDDHSFWRGMYDAAKDTGFLTGGASDLINAGSLLATKQNLDNGVHTEAGDMLMQQAVKNSDAQSQYGDNQGWMYTGGVITTNMAPFMVQIGSAGFSKGMSNAIGKVVQGAASKVALGTMEKATGIAGAHIANYIGKVTGLTTKAFGKAIQYGIVGAAQANTVGLGNVANDVINRYTGQVYQDEQGNYKFGTFDSDGKLVHEGGEDFLTALVKGEAAQTIEFATELAGGGIDAAGTALKNFVTKGGKKIINKYNMENVSKVIDFLLNNKVSKNARYLKAGADRTLGKVEVNSIVGESLEEELGIIANTVFTGDNKISDLWDEKQQSQIWGGMLLSIGLMKGAVAPFHAYNAKQYYSYKHKLDKADVNLSQLLGKEKWEELRNQIDATTNEDMPEMVNKINRDVALGKNRQPVREYIQNLLIMRGYDIGNMLAAKKAVEDKGEGVSVKNMEKNQAYQQGRDAYGYDTHEIQLDQEDKQKSLAQLLGISEQQLASMSNEELEALSGRDDNIDRAIYDYQLSTARYEGVIDNARDQIDLEVQRAAQAVDMYTDKSRNTIRNATIKATGGLEDYGVYIINGNIATHEDGSIDISNSDDMILYYDPTTNTVEHADAMMFAELGSEENADEVRSQAMVDAKEKAIKETTGIIDGVVEVGTQFKTVDADGTEHTYEVLADNGDGTAMITIDGNIPTELVKGENVNIPVSFEELQKMKDESDQQKLQAAKAQREQMEKERAEQQNQETEETQPSFDFKKILNDNGNVVPADVLDEDGNTRYPNSKLFLIRDSGAKAKVVELKSDGTLKSHAVDKKDVRTATTMTLDEYKQAMPESSMIEDNSGTIDANRGSIEVEDNTQPLSETDADNVIAQMESSAETVPDLELTPDNWAAEFGEDGILSTPIGDVKMGENQVAKLFEKGRSKEFGMIKPTLTNPDVIIEVPSHSTDGNEERSSSYLFIKTFLGKNGKKVYYFKSVTIRKDGLEISISSHYDRAKRVKEALMKGKLLYRKNDGAQTEQNQPSASVTTSQEDAAGSSESKDTNISSNGNENNESLTFEDGTPIPVDVNGEVDLSQTDASHAAEWYDNNLGEDADDWLDGEIKKAKKVLEQAKNKKLTGSKPSELVASKKEKEAAIADAQAHYDSAISIRDSLKERRIAKEENTSEGRKELIEKARRKFARLKSAVKDDAEAVSQLYRDTIGSLLHRLYDGTGIDVTDTIPLTAEEYVASNLGAHSLNYEGTETSKGVKQETGLSREDFVKTQLLAADGKGTTIDALVHSLWENRPSNLESLDTQDIRNALIGVLNSGFKASEARNFVENIRIAQAESILEEQKRAQENAAYAEQHKAEPEAELEAKSDEKAELKAKSEAKLDNESDNKSNDLSNETDNEKINDNINDNINAPEVPEDATDENPLGLQLSEDKVPFEIEGGKSGETYDINDNEDRQRLINDNKVDDKDILDIDMPKHVHKAIKELCKKMGLKVQFLYMGARSNGWIENGTMYLALDTEKATQFVFGHEMTHAIKQKNHEAYNELVKVAMAVTTKKKFEEDLAKVFQNYHGISGYNNVDDYVEEVVADNVGKFINDFDLAQKFSLRLNHPVLATILHAIQKIKSLLYGDFYKSVDALERIVEKAYVDTAKGEVTNSETGEDVSFSLRQKPEPKKKGIGYKVFVLKDGKLYPPMVANPDGAATPVGVWLDADAAPIAGESKTGRPQVKQGGKGTQGGSGKLAYRPGWHLGVVPYAIQFNRKDAEGNKTLFPKNFVFAEVEYAADVDYQEEARQEGINPSGKYQHSLAGLKHLPTDGYYMYRTNPNPETDPWVITGAMKVNRILTRAEQAELVKNAGREPQQIQEGDIVTDDIVNSINQEIADAPKFSLKVYHGSGADFTEFDFDHMGEGAGSQVFGWGGYVTSSKKIGKDYASIKYDPDKDVEYVGKNKKTFTDLIATLFDGGIRDYNYVKNILLEISDNDKSNISKKEEYDWFVSTKPEDWFNPNPTTNRNLYEVNIPEDNGSNYLEWEKTLTEKQINAIRDALAKNGVDISSFEKRGFKLDLPFKYVYTTVLPMMMHSKPKDVSKFLSSLGFTGIKYPAGTIMGGAEEGDTNYVIFKPEDMRITEHTKFSLKSKPVRFEAGKKLSDEEKKEVLSTLKDAYKVIGVSYHIEETAGGKEKRVYEPTADSYVVSDITNRPLRYYITLPDGRLAHPTEVYPNISDNEVKSSATKQGLLDEEVDQIVSAAIGNMKDIADNAKAIEVLTELQNLPHETHDVGYGMNNAQSYNYKTGIFTSDAAQAIDYVVRRMRRKEDVPTEIPAALKKAVADSYGMVDNLIDGMSSTNFSLKDNQGNPLNQDGTLKLDKIKSVDELTDEDFTSAFRNVELPAIPKNVDAAIGANGKPVIIKKNIFEKNWNAHKFTPAESKKVLNDALYNTDLVGHTQPTKKPNHWVAIKLDDKSPITVLEVNDNKNNVEVVGWYTLDERNLGRIKRQAERNGGELIMLTPKDDKVESLSTPPLSSAAKIDNSSETTKENGEKFSLKDEKTLAGVHNISEEKLLKAIKQGGLANPSVAVIDSSKQKHEGYGDISLILPSDKVAKRTGKNAGTWQGDAYTPTYPQVEKQISNKGSVQVNKDVLSVQKEMQHEVRSGIDRWILDGNDSNSGLKYLFLHEKGVAPEPKKIQPKFSDEAYNELKFITAGDFNIYGIGKADAQKVLDMYIEAKFDGDKDLYEEKTKAWLERNKSIVDAGAKGGMRYAIAKENVELYDEYGFNYKGVQTFVRDVEYDHRKSGVDTNATLNEVEDYIKTNNLTDEFNTWLEGKEKEYGIKEVIFDGFTPSGNRRYVPNTLENVSKIMKKQGRNGATGTAVSFQNFAARLMPSYGTLKDIRSKKGLLTSDREEFDKFREKWSNVFYELGMKCQPDATGTFDDYGLARLSEAAMTSDPQAYLKKEYNVDFSDEDTKRLKEMVKAIKEEHPAMYFETKFERPVRFDEFSAAVVPTTTKKEVKEALKNAGVSIFEYDEKNDADRSRAFNEAINSSDNIRFSLKSMMEKPEGWKQANKKAIHIAEVIERDPKFSLKNLDGTLIKAGTYFSGGGLVEEGLKGIIDPVLAVEYDEKISGVYRNNFGQHIVTADVRDVDPRELVKQIDGEVEYFHASPVCKNYSQAKSNHAEVELDKETAASTAEFINAIKPKVVTIENVKGYKDSEAMKTITDALDANGYTWDADVYNAADYGGYTNRERLIVRAVRDGKLPEKPKKMARKSGWYEAVADIIPTLTEKKNGVAPWMDIRLKADGIDWRNIDKPLYVMGSAYADGKVPHAFADELLPTLRTKSGDVIVMPDGKVYRAMGRVLARVSGVSDDYKMPFSESLSHTIIGNGIPTQLTEHVIAPLLQNTLRPTTPDDGNTKFSLRYDQFEHDLNQWKKDNNLPKDAQRPTIPQRNAGESAVDFLRRVDEYRKQMALWKTAPTYEQHLLSDDTALGEFNRELQRGSVLKRIAFQDSMLAIRKAQEAIMKEVGVDRLNMAEDAYTAENRSHGKGKNEFEEYNNEFLQPLRKAYHQMKKVLGDSYDNVRIYMMAKHGLERDAQMAFKKSLDADFEDVAQRSAAYKAYKGDMNRIINDSDLEFGRVDFTTWRQRDNALRVKYSPSYMDYRYDKNGIAYDYSGLSALFDGSDFEEAAYKLVKDIEDKYVTEIHNLWDATNAATKKILRDGYKAGMMSKDTYQYVRDMYSHYIPLRGWDGTTADQVWDYIGGGKGSFNQTLKKAHGRTSIADDPIAYIENMAESGILLNNKNWVKQHLMLLAQNHPTSLLTLSKAWYVKSTDANGNEEWIPATPQITYQMDSNQVKAAIDAFEKKMEQMAQTGDATQKRDGLNIAYPQTHSEEREHEVRVMKDGEEYVIYVNGDPQLAQAMNNTRAHRVSEGIKNSISKRVIAVVGRKMAAAYTSLSPLFIPSNYFRDLTMTLASTAIREDAKYNYLLGKNLTTSWNLGFMLKDYQNGKLREKVNNGNATPKEQMFYDFMMNGGETGFVSSLDVEDLKKKFKNDLKDLDRWKANPVKVGHTIMDSIEFLNRMIEDSNRFAVYMTSIQYGRSIDEAVNDAKDVTLNFNRKGTGEYGWQMIRNLYLFINPAVQSLQTLGALAKHHPFKFTAVTASWLTSGVLVPIVNAAFMQMAAAFLGGDGDDDKDWYKDISKKYWQFSKWDRRNNFIMWVPTTHEFVKIPLAQEFRAFYGLGDMIASKMMGGELAEESWEDYGWDLVGQVVDMLPLDPTGYDGELGVSLMPNPIRPVFELAFNVDFTGKPLFKETEYNKYDPNFTKAYVGTPDWLVRASKMVNSIGNDYPDVQQNSIDAFGDPRYNLNNPAVVDHVLSSYLGGAYTMGSQVLGVLTKSLNDPKEIKVADIPLFSKFVSNPDDRPVTKKQGDEFWDMKENHDRAANTLSKLKKQANVDGDYSMLERFYGSEEYKQYKQDDVKVKKYEEDKKKERAEEIGEEYRPHKLNAEDIYKAHATPKDDFEDLKLKQLYTKLNGFKTSYDLLVDTAPSQSDVYYNTNKAAIDAIDEIALDKQEISELKKGFLDDGKDAYNAEDMKQIRELRKKILAVLEKANKVVVASQKAKAEK